MVVARDGLGERGEAMAVERATRYVVEPAPLLCPVCKKVFSEPIISVKCGHTFCKKCIESLMSVGSPCPVDGQDCNSGQLVTNLAIMGQLVDLKIYCCHGLRPVGPASGSTHTELVEYEVDPEGCPDQISLGQRQEHEDSCLYAHIDCSVGGAACGPIRKKNMETHLEICSLTPCPYSDFGEERVGV